MIKGIYNENEFYTNHWATKYFDELKSKIQNVPNLKEKIDQLKSISAIYWDLTDSKDISSLEKNDLFESFYQKLFEILGHAWLPTKRQTLDGRYYTSVSETKKDSKSHVILALTNQKETGSFENIPYQLSKLDFDEQEEADDRELTEIVSEELESETGPKWFILGSLDGLFLIERTKWAYGRFIRINFTEVFSQKDEDVYTSLIGLFSRDILAPDSGVSIHSELDDNSHRYAFAVTTELREGVREAIELLINEMIYAKREAKQEFLKKGKESNEYAKELSHDALFYVYRLIFLLFLESQGEDSELLPLKSEIYRHGYMLEKLLEVTFKKIHEGTQEYEGTFIQESLERIFDLIFNGFAPQKSADLIARDLSSTGFLVKGLKSDLFDPEKVKHLKGVTLRNGVLQKILQKLSMADMKEGKKTRKARVSYANLGINQLGAVYEGLLSYTGFFAQEDLYELTQIKKGKDDDEDEGSDESESDDTKTKIQKIDPDKVYLAPKSLVEKYKKDKKYKLTERHFVLDPETGEPVIYKKGSFMFRMAGRDRQKLASFYTPESLTKCTVKYALKVLFESKKTLEELKKVKILEPAMGSGAFLNEAVNQLSDRILELEVKESFNTYKTPKDRQKRLWDIKYHLISNNVYGVDLNPTAIELARFSLWLNCIGAGKEPPKFDSRLKIGNSLIGARFKKNADGIFPWLVLDKGMMDYGKKLFEYDNKGAERIKAHRDIFLKSEINGSDKYIKAIQQKAEKVFENIFIENDETKHSYEKLKFCTDLWCSLFFINNDNIDVFPETHKDLLITFEKILESGSSAIPSNLRQIIEKVSESERFFHWEIEFPNLVRDSGFDLILGNPPWVAVEWQDALYVSDFNIMPLVLSMNAASTRKFIAQIQDPQIHAGLSRQFIQLTGYSKMLETDTYKVLKGLSKNTYKAFDVIAISLISSSGVIGIIQDDGLLEERSADDAREMLYKMYRYHFQFFNEKYLFAEVNHRQKYSINIFGKEQKSISFFHIGNLFSPTTIEESFTAKTTDPVPLIKDDQGNWNTKGHPSRIIEVNDELISTFSKFQSNSNVSAGPVFLNLHTKDLASVISKISRIEQSIDSYLGTENSIGSVMFDETKAQDIGYVKIAPSRSKSIEKLVLTAPMISANNPLFQEVSTEYKNKSSYDYVNLLEISDNFLPKSLFHISEEIGILKSQMPTFQGVPYSEYYRIISRGMINSANERSLFTCLIPPGVIHLNGLRSFTTIDPIKLCEVGGLASTLVYDGICRLKNKINFYYDDFRDFPMGSEKKYLNSIARRFLSLNCLTSYYSSIWIKTASLKKDDSLMSGFRLIGYGEMWSSQFSVKNKSDRTQAQIELDALSALSLGLTANELEQIYTNLFPVLRNYDRKEKVDRIMLLQNAFNFFEKRGW